MSTPTIEEILIKEFLDPAHIPVSLLANHINISESQIRHVLADQSEISADLSIRLGRFFGVSDGYFLNFQKDIDLRNAEEKNRDDYDQIKQHQAN
ncbi:HigA family addiction module antitoxin [Lentilactobacillus otakiensis]|uniref:HigA family addiction module antitoxin n=1 Tax=Lentilactobacillus otakiensis TaxID=481720 RepID=UPI003D1743B2